MTTLSIGCLRWLSKESGRKGIAPARGSTAQREGRLEAQAITVRIWFVSRYLATDGTLHPSEQLLVANHASEKANVQACPA